MIDEERAELKELQEKESLTDEETARAAELEQKDTPPEDDFDKAFDDALAEDDPDTDINLDDDNKSKHKVDSNADNDNDDNDDDDESIFNKTVSDSDDDDDVDNNPERKIADLEAQLAANNQRMSSWEGRIKAANKAKEEAEAKLNGDDSKHGKVDKTTPEEDEEADTILSEFITEFPSLEQPIKIMAKKIAGSMIESKLADLTPKLESIEEHTKEESSKEHFDKIKKAHEDYEKIYDSGALNTWIESQPKFLQPGLQVVIEEGTAEEIIEMFDAYKKIVGHTKSDNKDISKSQKLKNLEAVNASSAGPRKEKKKADKDDFDSAWDEAMSKDK